MSIARSLLRRLPAVALPVAALTTPILGAQAQTKAVLVTGASTGIGRKITEALAANGYFVYAGARKPQDLEELSKIKNVQGIKLDVTVPAEIAAAVATVEKGGKGLYGLVNNAGVAVIEPLMEVDEEDLKFQLDVNTMGPYRVTKAFSKLLIASHGRVVITGSLSGYLSGMLSGPYSMSKHAMEAFTDALAAEMARYQVKVSILEPGNYQSDIEKTLKARMQARGKTIEGSAYAKELKGFLGREQHDPEADDVAQAALKALGDPNPLIRYLVAPNQREAEITIRSVLLKVAQLNQSTKFGYSRDSLVAMLDQMIARAAQTGH